MLDELPDPSWALDLDDEDFALALVQRSFEELRDTARALAERIDSDEVGLDRLALTVRRAQAILDECERRIRAVEAELNGDDDPF
jgi:exonuclease VII small subunit